MRSVQIPSTPIARRNFHWTSLFAVQAITRIDRMSARDKLVVDIVHVLPEVFRAGVLEGCNRVDVAGDLQNAAPDCREDLLHVDDGAVIEGMDGALGAGFT